MNAPKPHLTWTVNVPMVFTVIISVIAQIVTITWIAAVWKTSIEGQLEVMDGRVAVLERLTSNSNMLAERVKGVEVKIELLKDQSGRIEQKLDRVIERR